jgi:hypothetical protein
MLLCIARGLKALRHEEFFDFGRFECFHGGLIEFVDDRPRRIGRSRHAVPARRFVFRHVRLRNRRHVRRDREPVCRGIGENDGSLSLGLAQ